MQEYKLVVRGFTQETVTAPDGTIVTQNPGEFSDYLYDNYLSQGWSILSVDLVRVLPSVEGSLLTYEFAYHLLRDVAPKEKVSKKSE